MISSKCRYALKAMLELARQEGTGPITIGAIAERRDIPSRFLEGILRELKQAGLTDSTRGKDGGYRLARPAMEITVGEVIRIFEGPLIDRAERQGYGDVPDVFVPVWNQANEALHQVFDEFTFSKLIENERELIQTQAPNYTI